MPLADGKAMRIRRSRRSVSLKHRGSPYTSKQNFATHQSTESSVVTSKERIKQPAPSGARSASHPNPTRGSEKSM
jgi:hypothetical protein